MTQESQKAVAIFIASEPREEESDAAKQVILRECAIKLGLIIVSFVAIPRASLFERLSQALGICRSNGASFLLIDEKKTFFLTHRELKNFLEILFAHKISIVAARSGLIIEPDYLALFGDFLNLSAQAEHEKHIKSIKKSLRQKKRQGIKLGGKKYAEAEIIKQITDLYKLKKSLHEICNILSSHDIKSTHNKKWHPTTIKRIIDRENKKNKTPDI